MNPQPSTRHPRRPSARVVLGAGTALALLAGSGSIAAMGAGALDSSFGTKGVVLQSLGAGSDTTAGVVAQADGKLLVVGTSTSTTAGTTSGNIVVERFTTAGKLDKTFGAGNKDGSPDGVVSLSLGAGEEAGADLALQADGKILVAGTTTSLGTSANVFVARLAPNGTPDASFGVAADGTPDGFVNVSFSSGNDSAAGLVIAPGGKIIVAGDSVTASGNDIALARLLAR